MIICSRKLGSKNLGELSRCHVVEISISFCYGSNCRIETVGVACVDWIDGVGGKKGIIATISRPYGLMMMCYTYAHAHLLILCF